MKSKTYQRKACNGNSLYITINRNEGEEFNSILINPPAKNNDCGGSYAYSLQDLLTFCLRKRENGDLKKILKCISGHHCHAVCPNKWHGKSCSDYIAQIIKEEFPND